MLLRFGWVAKTVTIFLLFYVDPQQKILVFRIRNAGADGSGAEEAGLQI